MVIEDRRRMMGAVASCLLALSCASWARGPEALPVITLSGSTEVKDSVLGRWLQLIYTEAFARLGYQFKYAAVPMRRSSAMSAMGLSDGEINRAYDYGQYAPQLVRVEEPHVVTRYMAYATRPGLHFNGWSSLSGTGLKVGYFAGAFRVERMLEAVLPQADLSAVGGVDIGLQMLYLRRIDLFVYNEILIQDWLHRIDSSTIDKSLFYPVGEMEPISYYAFLAPKFAALAPKLAEVLRKMRKEGLIEQYRVQAQGNG